ncbi:MAG: NFYB/HAP3 family transcription factor subunit [Candidatus Micrarchaeaceae archaeon]
MASLSKEAIKKIVARYAHAKITDDAAAAMAAMLERKAREIARYAVKNAKKKKRVSVTKEDIQEYIFKKGA